MQEARKASDAKMVKILGASLKLPESSHWTGSSSVKRYLTLLKNLPIHPSISFETKPHSSILSPKICPNKMVCFSTFHISPPNPCTSATPNSHCQTNHGGKPTGRVRSSGPGLLLKLFHHFLRCTNYTSRLFRRYLQ